VCFKVGSEGRLWLCSPESLPIALVPTGSLGAHRDSRSLCSREDGHSSAWAPQPVLGETALQGEERCLCVFVFVFFFKVGRMTGEFYNSLLKAELSRKCSQPPAHSGCALTLYGCQTVGKKCGWTDSFGA